MSVIDHFVNEIKNSEMDTPLEILNWYRNLYHAESSATEQGIMAMAINSLFSDYEIVKKSAGLQSGEYRPAE